MINSSFSYSFKQCQIENFLYANLDGYNIDLTAAAASYRSEMKHADSYYFLKLQLARVFPGLMYYLWSRFLFKMPN